MEADPMVGGVAGYINIKPEPLDLKETFGEKGQEGYINKFS
jgi:hypothetical protein